ncbi:MAG: proline dehydrogenase family protein [Candidatus Promineifilaceae bacterium]|nr:proline dehydrogenase family protein [Candidatus Promineifilaceae bacterium]
MTATERPITAKITRLLLPFLLLALLLLFLIRYGSHWLRHILIYLSHAAWARKLVSGFPLARRVALRFVAGETIDEAMNAAQELNRSGMLVTLDYLGESVTDVAEARASKDEILRLLERIRQAGVDGNVSVKLTQLGLRIDPGLALEHMSEILEKARLEDNWVRIDMEESELVDQTLAIFRELRNERGFDNVGVVIQAYLYRSEDDVRRLIQAGAGVRLCKGAYAEPAEVAFPDKQDTDRNFVHLTNMLLDDDARHNGVYAGIATHDEAMIAATIEIAERQNIPPDDFEFQMLYGVGRELQSWLVQQGYKVRIYVPYGTAWYPYFVRRLAERPANLWFFLSNLLRA